jgi:hypothetical protein
MAKKKDILFSIYENPIDSDTLKNTLNGKITINKERFIGVIVKTLSDSGKIPTQVSLDLKYFQQDSRLKKLVTAYVSFSGFIDPATYPADTVFNYTLTIDFTPMTHTQLLIQF